MSPVGLNQYREAQEAYKNGDEKSLASGVILHRKDQPVLDGKYKWIPCVWKLEGSTLTMVPSSSSLEVSAFRISTTTQYKKPKSKHYPLQFGKSPVFTSAILEKVIYEASGYAPSPIDPLSTGVVGSTAVQGMCKVAALEQEDLEKLLLCIQAVVDGKPAAAYLKS